MHISTFDNHGIRAKWEIVEKLCGPTTMGPTLDRARRFAADELPISLNLVDLDKDQTLDDRVWIESRLLVWQVPRAGQEMWDSRRGRILIEL